MRPSHVSAAINSAERLLYSSVRSCAAAPAPSSALGARPVYCCCAAVEAAKEGTDDAPPMAADWEGPSEEGNIGANDRIPSGPAALPFLAADDGRRAAAEALLARRCADCGRAPLGKGEADRRCCCCCWANPSPFGRSDCPAGNAELFGEKPPPCAPAGEHSRTEPSPILWPLSGLLWRCCTRSGATPSGAGLRRAELKTPSSALLCGRGVAAGDGEGPARVFPSRGESPTAAARRGVVGAEGRRWGALPALPRRLWTGITKRGEGRGVPAPPALAPTDCAVANTGGGGGGAYLPDIATKKMS